MTLVITIVTSLCCIRGHLWIFQNGLYWTRVSNGMRQCNFSGQRDRLSLLVPGQRDNGTYLSRDKGTPGQKNFFVPGQRDNGTSRPVETLDSTRLVSKAAQICYQNSQQNKRVIFLINTFFFKYSFECWLSWSQLFNGGAWIRSPELTTNWLILD